MERSDAKAAIAWHEDILDRLKGYPDYLRKYSELGAKFRDKTFDTLDSSKSKKVALGYVDNFSVNKWREKNSLIINGPTGTGKTHLAAAIANKLIDEKKVSVFFVNAPDAYDRIRDEIASKDYTKATMKSCDLLIIDDLGKEKQTDWTDQVLYEVINHRYESKLPVVITTNYSGQELVDHIDKAAASRLMEMSYFTQTTGEDRRNK